MSYEENMIDGFVVRVWQLEGGTHKGEFTVSLFREGKNKRGRSFPHSRIFRNVYFPSYDLAKKAAEEYISKIRLKPRVLKVDDMSEWQPIETAPKDGTEILGCDDEGIRCVIRWSKHNHVPIYGWVRQIELYGEEVEGFDALYWCSIPHQPPTLKVNQGEDES